MDIIYVVFLLVKKMIIHQEGSGDPHTITKYSFELQNWKEYFCFLIPDDHVTGYYEVLKTLKGYKYFKYYDPLRDCSTIAVRWWFVPFWGLYQPILLGIDIWWTIAKFFRRRGYLKGLKEGQAVHWFWLIYFFKK